MNVFKEFEKIKGNYLKNINLKPLNLKDIYNINSDFNKEVIKIISGVNNEKSKLYIRDIRALQELLDRYSINPCNFYYEVYRGYLRLFYIYGGFIMDIQSSYDILTLFENIKLMQEEFNSYYLDKEDMPMFLFIKASKLYFPQMVEFLQYYTKSDDLKNIVKDYQKSSDYNSNNFSLSIIEKVYKDTVCIIDNFLEDGYIDIYRGVGSKSKDINSAYSWTLNIDVAKFFATRAINSEKYIEDIHLYKAKVDKNAILGVIVDNEEEVLINPNLIKNYKIEDVDFDKSVFHQMPKERKYLFDKYKLKDLKEEEIEEIEEIENEKIVISKELLNLFNL